MAERKGFEPLRAFRPCRFSKPVHSTTLASLRRYTYYHSTMKKIIDLTHCFTSEMPVYPGDPTPKLQQSAFLDQHGLNDFQLSTGMHVGTHMDGPLHMIAGEKKLCDFPVDTFLGRGVLVDCRGQTRIDAPLLQNVNLQPGDIVLVRTGFSEFFGQQKYFEDFPKIAENFAAKLIDAGVKILGLDCPSPDRSPFPIHKILLSHEVLIIENLTNLDRIPTNVSFQIMALPMKIDTDSALVRVIAKIS